MTKKQRKLLRNYALAVLGAGAVGVSLYVGGIDWQNRQPESITVDGQTIEFTHTDDWTGEDLLIFTDAETYENGLTHATVYAAVVNRSSAQQDVSLMGYFGDERQQIGEVSVLTNATFEVPVYEEQCITEEAPAATSTDATAASTIERCEQVQVGTTEETRPEWVPLPQTRRDVLEVAAEQNKLGTRVRKAVSDFEAQQKTVPFPLGQNEVLYYRLKVEYPPNAYGSFYLEAIGDQGGYGHMF